MHENLSWLNEALALYRKLKYMKKALLIFTLLLPLASFCQYPVIASQRYSWKKPVNKIAQDIFSTTLFEGSSFDMEYLHMATNAIAPSKRQTNVEVPLNEEHLLLVKDGMITIQIYDSIWSVGGGSIALLMPGTKYTVQNESRDSCNYFTMKYRSKSPVDVVRGNAAGGPLVIDWDKIFFKRHDRGGIRNYFDRATAMSKRFEMHVTTLNEGIKSHEPHTHRAEEIVLIIDNKTEMQIGDKLYKGSAGDLYYLGSNVPHAVRNDGKGTCTYFAFQFE